MSEPQARPSAPRGRSSARGGRGGPRAGGRGGKHVNGDHKTGGVDTTADQGELAVLKKQYLPELSTLKELFEDWTDVDLLLALQESGGDLSTTIDRISEGNVSKFAEVPKAKDRARSKVKDTTGGAAESNAAAGRTSRGRGGADGSRGGRGRGGFRGGSRGSAQANTNGARGGETAKSVPTTESSAWDSIPSANKENAPVDTVTAENGDWGSPPAPAVAKSGLPVESVAKPKTWASMFAPKPKATQPKPEAKASPVEEPEKSEAVEPITAATDGTHVAPEVTPNATVEDSSLELTPSKDELTEDNVEHLPDDSKNKPMTETAASQVGSARDIGSATPSVVAQPSIGRPNIGGYATTALKATTGVGRTPSFQRKIMEQREAVVMPSNDAVHRSAVQFGMMDLNGEALDVDEDREDAETRPQAPPQSPPAQPKTSLPPVPRQPQTEPIPEPLPTPRQSQGLPPAPAQQSSPSTGLGSLPQPSGQTSQAFNQFGRFGPPSAQPEAAAPPQKPYDAFGQQASPLDAYGSQPHAQPNMHPQLGGQSTASHDYPSYYTADQRNAYQNYYNNPYGQQQTPSHQDAASSQQRTGSGFGAAPSDSGFLSQAQQASSQSRFGDAQGSGQNTPNPALGSAANQAPSHQNQHLQQQQQQQQQALNQSQYPNYNQHPYYNSPYYQSYMNYQQSYQGGFGGPYGGNRGTAYGQHHPGYGISPQQSTYDQHFSSPANASGLGQSSLHRESGLAGNAGGLGDFTRSGSTQPSQGAQHGGSAGFGAMGDIYGRAHSGYPGSNQGYGNQQQVTHQAGNEDALKPYGDAKAAGPSPSTIGQPGRPGSATNTSASQGQSGLPPPQSHQQGFGAYPNNFGQGSHYGGLGGLGNQGGATQTQGGFGGYGGYGNQHGSYSRGGWGTNYASH